MKSLPEEPEKPLRDDCCGGGSCCPCIWDVYYEKLAKWKEAKREFDESANNESSDTRSPDQRSELVFRVPCSLFPTIEQPLNELPCLRTYLIETAA